VVLSAIAIARFQGKAFPPYFESDLLAQSSLPKEYPQNFSIALEPTASILGMPGKAKKASHLCPGLN
ncbi:MAG: hypothetical protein ACREX3_09840, partial [Gammaproteobacteria bacterium]